MLVYQRVFLQKLELLLIPKCWFPVFWNETLELWINLEAFDAKLPHGLNFIHRFQIHIFFDVKSPRENRWSLVIYPHILYNIQISKIHLIWSLNRYFKKKKRCVRCNLPSKYLPSKFFQAAQPRNHNPTSEGHRASFAGPHGKWPDDSRDFVDDRSWSWKNWTFVDFLCWKLSSYLKKKEKNRWFIQKITGLMMVHHYYGRQNKSFDFQW